MEIYKCDQKITTKKPRKSHIIFKFDTNDSSSEKQMKSFVKDIITDVKELNFLRNDVAFLIHDLYETVPVYDHLGSDGTIPGGFFYAWIWLPVTIMSTAAKKEIIFKNVIPFDLFFLRKKLNVTECNKIIQVLKSDANVHIHYRQYNEQPKLPFEVSVTLKN